MGALPRRVTVMLAGSAACAAAGKTNKEYRSKASVFVVFIIVSSVPVEFKRVRIHARCGLPSLSKEWGEANYLVSTLIYSQSPFIFRF